ncbi:ester cyclase [Natrononativus amylolyticus]|uniref:ester cyclase n=1 Tax=Natrononativus amylolyticus TaxID=2963434 RepID=UPI0020CF21DF|nr:ester cyclase [Natrononativus amylolyticus]
MTTPDENKEIVQRVQYDTYTGEEDLDVIDELVSDEFVMHDPVSGDIHGPDGFKEYVETFQKAFGELTLSVEHMVVEDDIVASHGTARGTHEGQFPGLDVEPTGEEFEASGMEIDRIEDGKLVESWFMPDALGLLQQLGALPEEGVSPEH